MVICQGAGWIGSVFVRKSLKDWYGELNKPDFIPPNWLFVPVWSALYFLMAIALFLVWQERKVKHIVTSLFAFFVQLLLNIWWPAMFFGRRCIEGGLAVSMTLLVSILVTMAHFFSIEPIAALLLLPYATWVSFSTYFNYILLQLNRVREESTS